MRDRTWWSLVAIAALFFAGLGSVALLDPDEGRYAVTARTMLASGDWVVPSFNGEPRLNKPPLLYWTVAAAFALLGQSEAAARLPSALAALLTVGIAGWWAGRRLSSACRAPAMLALAGTPLFFACARLAITDMLLALGVTASLLFWYEAVHADRVSARRGFAVAASLAGGVAFLAKGPVGPLLATFAILISSAIERRAGLVTMRGWLTAAAGLLVVAGPWCALLASRIGFPGVGALLKREALDRTLTGLDHPRPFWYLIATFWVIFLPWAFVMPAALWRALRARDATAGPARFLSVWLLVTVLFFTLMPGKNDAYLLPIAPAVALLAAWRLPRRAVMAGAAIMGLALLSALFYFGGELSEKRSLRAAVASAGLAERGELTLLSYKLYKPSLVFYARRPTRWLTSEEELQAALAARAPGESVAIMMEDRRRAQVGEMLTGFTVAGAQRGYVVLFSP